MGWFKKSVLVLVALTTISTTFIYICKLPDGSPSTGSFSLRQVVFATNTPFESKRLLEPILFGAASDSSLELSFNSQGGLNNVARSKLHFEHKTASLYRKPYLVSKKLAEDTEESKVQVTSPLRAASVQEHGRPPQLAEKSARNLRSKTAGNVDIKRRRGRNPVDHILVGGFDDGTNVDTLAQNSRSRGSRSLAVVPARGDSLAKVFRQTRTLLAFIGYPRSGHTLVSSLLDAHPHIAVANEYQIFQRWLTYNDTQRNRLFVFTELYKAAASASEKGIRSNGGQGHPFNYSVPGEWNGKNQGFIQVIGDKHGPKSAQLLFDENGKKILADMQEILQVSVRLIHAVRNPYDNIATMAIRVSNNRQFIKEGKVLDDPTRLEQQTRIYASLLRDNYHLRNRFHVFDVHNSDMIAHPKETLEQICRFLHVDCTSQYLTHCASIVFSSPSRTRNNVKWTAKVKVAVEYLIQKYPFLSRYTFDSN